MRTLLIDTCGESGSVALTDAEEIKAFRETPARSASASLVLTISSMLQELRWSKGDLEAVGVVSGPGSFTGVRVGMACAKGLCESLGLALAALSRLNVLASSAGLVEGFGVLNAGRDEVFTRRAPDGSEALFGVEEFTDLAASSRVVVAEEHLIAKLGRLRQMEFRPIDARSALPLLQASLRAGVHDFAGLDANYVRGEQQIYGRSSGATSSK